VAATLKYYKPDIQDFKELKGYGLKNGTGKIIHFNASGRGGRALLFRNHQLVKETKTT
jgi:hypothetical protein